MGIRNINRPGSRLPHARPLRCLQASQPMLRRAQLWDTAPSLDFNIPNKNSGMCLPPVVDWRTMAS
jgi:hypothetical protein